MSQKIYYLKDHDVVVFKTSGTYELGKEIPAVRKVMEALRTHNCNKCLTDHRDTHVIADITDAFDRSDLYEEYWGDRTTSLAVVYKEITDNYRFLEDACRNRGWNLRSFTDYDEALKWLSTQ